MNIYTCAGVVSLLSLLIIFIVYWYVPDFNTLPGRIVLSNVISITLVTVFLLTVYNAPLDDIDKLLCTIIGFFGYFSSISMFSWMTIMCFDLSSTLFREDFCHNSKYGARFASYSLIGWGVGLSLMIGLLLLQNTLTVESDFNPDIGDNVCFISNEGNKRLFLFHFPILLTMLFNIAVFISIIIFILQSKFRTKEAGVSIR